MEKRIIVKFYNYIQEADKIKNENIDIYFFIKSIAFNSIYSFISLEIFPKEEKKKIQTLYTTYKTEKDSYQSKNKLNEIKKEEFQKYLESFFSKMDFKNLDNLYLSRDMLELLLKFGPLDDLTVKRLQYLNNHISTLTIKKEEKKFNYNDINENLKNSMSEFNFPISNKNLNFKKFEDIIISTIENSSFDIECGNYEEGKNLLESVLYYLINVKKE
jgi:hypothetical protein